MKKFKVGNYEVTVEAIPPEIGMPYHHKDRSDHDMISYVLPKEVQNGQVTYRKFYKAQYVQFSSDMYDSCSITEFNKWFRKGA